MSQLLPDNLSSLEVLFKQHYTELCRYALKLTRNNEVAEEVVQEVFVNFWERREEINISYSVKAYLVASVRNRSINYLKLQLD
ncbi:MAG: sigma-70 family RNA polymerase sigma factor, partial [Imperialibacter sp.]|uniref:sigma-70 family RNA polymerase sigma factor n=1 Tax=Imperialibacter sp. TaxID=2038411 RepID=UPI0032EB93A0